MSLYVFWSQVAEATEEDGLYLYRHMLLPELHGLVWIGANVSALSQSLTANVQVSAHDSSVGWCTVLVGAAVLTNNVQAVWLLQLLEGRHSLPTKQQMQTEVHSPNLNLRLRCAQSLV